MNIFGEGRKEGLTNPLTEDLLAAGFSGFNFNEVHLNELHDNSGSGKIIVHEEFNMTNNTIGNLADPVAAKDAVTLGYAESNFASQATVPTTAPYDLYGAFTDEDTPISTGQQPLTLNVPRDFTCSGVRAFLKNGPTTAPYYVIQISKNGLIIPQVSLCEFELAGYVTSTLGTFTGDGIFLSMGDKLTIGMNADATASGLKVVFYGTVPI